MLFDEDYYYCFIDEKEFDSKCLFVNKNGIDKCKREIITYYKDNEKIIKKVKSMDNYLSLEDLKDKQIITKYYIETFKLKSFDLTDKIYVKIFGLGCYFKYLKKEDFNECKESEEVVKKYFDNYDKKYIKLNDYEFLKGVE